MGVVRRSAVKLKYANQPGMQTCQALGRSVKAKGAAWVTPVVIAPAQALCPLESVGSLANLPIH